MGTDSTVTVEIWDAAGMELTTADLPVGEPVSRITLGLVEKLNLPRRSAEGQEISYKLNYHDKRRQLLGSETLGEAGVEDGSILRILREILAG